MHVSIMDTACDHILDFVHVIFSSCDLGHICNYWLCLNVWYCLIHVSFCDVLEYLVSARILLLSVQLQHSWPIDKHVVNSQPHFLGSVLGVVC